MLCRIAQKIAAKDDHPQGVMSLSQMMDGNSILQDKLFALVGGKCTGTRHIDRISQVVIKSQFHEKQNFHPASVNYSYEEQGNEVAGAGPVWACMSDYKRRMSNERQESKVQFLCH
jgi:hypothetical protein